MPAPETKYRVLKSCHPELDLEHVKKLRGLYRGGRHLLKNPELMKEIFPKHEGETEDSYRERSRRAHYVNNFGAVINYICAGLAQDPLRLAPREERKPDAVTPNPEASNTPPEPKPLAKLDEFWENLQESAQEPGADKRTFDWVIRAVVREALIMDWGWLQVELPRASGEATSLLEQLEAGELDGYFIPQRVEHVRNWHDIRGQLAWVLTYTCEQPQLDPRSERGLIVHAYTIWDGETWARYVVKEGGPDNLKLPEDEEMIPCADDGVHGFGRVPWLRLRLDDGLCAGDMLYSLAQEHFNQGNADAWNRLRNGYQQLYEFLGGEIPDVDKPISAAQADPNRARKRPRGPGTVQVRGSDDDAKYVGPDMGGTAVQRQALAELKDDMFRITGQMALSQDTNGAMIRRSGESKAQDHVATEVVLGALGKVERPFAQHAVELLAVGRGEAPEDAPEVQGAETFDASDADAMVERMVMLATADIPSATFKREVARDTAIACLESPTPETVAQIETELASAITQEAFTMKADAAAAALDREIKGEPPPGKVPPA